MDCNSEAIAKGRYLLLIDFNRKFVAIRQYSVLLLFDVRINKNVSFLRHIYRSLAFYSGM